MSILLFINAYTSMQKLK